MSADPSAEDPVGRIAESFVERYRRGERPSVEEYARVHPEVADELRELLPAVAMMEEAKDDGGATAPCSGTIDTAALIRTLQQLGDFRVVREIGRGGMGIVYEAEQISLRRRVALKVLPAPATLDPKRLRRFHREAQAAAHLHHTNIVPVYGIGETHGIHYFVMQYLCGQGLDKVIRELNRLRQGGAPAARDETQPGQADVTATAVALSLLSGATVGRTADATEGPEDAAPCAPSAEAAPAAQTAAPFEFSPHYWQSAARVGLQVAEALACAHAGGTIHRDIKPSNLLLDAHGTVWVTDFGLAKPDAPEDLTQSGELLGTLRYLAPELLAGKCDARSDIYSLGLTLYELCALAPARDAPDWNGLIQQARQGQIPPLGKRNPQTPRDLETIIHKATHPDPHRRYATADEMAADLRRYLNDEPIRARRVGAVERAARWCRRNPSLTLVSAAASLAVILTAAVALVLIDAARQRALDLADEQGRLAEENARLADEERKAREQVQQSWAREAQQRALAEKHRRDAERARDEQDRAAREAKAVNDFLILDMIGAASPERNLGRNLTVRAMLDRAAQRVGSTFSHQPPTQAAVRDAIGRAYHALGLYGEAHEQAVAAVDQYRRTLGPQHEDTLRATLNLASVLHHQAKYAAARRLEEEVLSVARRTLGPDHAQTLQAMGNLAATLHAAGQYAQAQKLLEETLEKKTKTFGLEAETTLATLGNLAINLEAQGRPAEAQKLNEQALAIKRRRFGDAAPTTLTSLNNLAVNLEKQGRHADGARLLEEGLRIKRQVLGPDHPDTIAAISNLAVNLSAQGKKAEAARWLEQAAAAFDRLLGADHTATLTATNNLAMNLLDQNKAAEAEVGLRRAAEAAQRTLGPEHPTTVQIHENLAGCLARQGKLDEAWELLERTALLRRKSPQIAPEKLAGTLESLGAVAFRQRRLPEAEKLFSEAAELASRHLGPEHLRTLRLKNLLAGTRLVEGRYREAEQGFREVFEAACRLLGREHPETLRLMCNVAESLRKQNRLDEARALFQEALTTGRRVLPPGDPLVALARQAVAVTQAPAQAKPAPKPEKPPPRPQEGKKA